MRPRLWNPEMELMSHSEMRALQLVKLKSLLNRVYEQSPYYRDKFDRAGVNPRNLDTRLVCTSPVIQDLLTACHLPPGPPDHQLIAALP